VLCAAYLAAVDALVVAPARSSEKCGPRGVVKSKVKSKEYPSVFNSLQARLINADDVMRT